MAISASGPESLPLEYTRELLSNSGNFQTWSGQDNATDALDYILYGSTDGQTVPHPVCMVQFGDQFDTESDSIDDGENFAGNDAGSILLTFEDSSVQGYDNEYENLLSFMNKVGGVLTDIKSLSGSELDDGTVMISIYRITRINKLQKVFLTENNEKAFYFQVSYEVYWK